MTPMIPRVNIAIVENDRMNADARKQAIIEIEEFLPALTTTTVFSNAMELISAVDEAGQYFEIILSDVYMPEKNNDSSAGTPQEGGLRIKEWLEAKRESDDDFSSVQLVLVSRYSDVSQFIHYHVNRSTSHWMDWVSHNNSFGIMKIDLTKVLDRAIRKYNPIDLDPDLPRDFITVAPKSLGVVQQARKLAPNDLSVLILGETGTGKELLARYVHEHSKRKGKAFVPINCAASAEGTLEDDLFGHLRGAFTGAFAPRPGFFATANGGTLFLDEIAEMSLGMQAKVLRIIQERQYLPLGSSKSLHTDFRLICATHRNLPEAIQNGNFREDLYYRIAAAQLKMPSLKERREDIQPLVDHFIQRFAHKFEKGLPSISKEARAALEKHDWPGNVRELENAIALAVALISFDGRIEISHLPDNLRSATESIPPGPLSPLEQRRYNAIAHVGYNLAAAARTLGLSKQALHKYVKEHPRLDRLVEHAADTLKAQRKRRRIDHPPAFRQDNDF